MNKRFFTYFAFAVLVFFGKFCDAQDIFSCTPNTDAIIASARGVEKNTSKPLECAVVPGATIRVAANINSELKRAQGFVVVDFLDAGGRRLWSVKKGPWLGEFKGLQFDESFRAPAFTKKIVINAIAESSRSEAAGSWSLDNIKIVPGIVVNADFVNGQVLVSPQPLVLKFGNVSRVSGVYTVSLLDRFGKEIAIRHAETDAEFGAELNFGSLNVGYYGLSVVFKSGNVSSSPWKSSFVVLPHGSPPKDVRFGMDAALSWYGRGKDHVIKSVELMRLAGIGAVRDRMTWSKIQPGKSRIDWGIFKDTSDIAIRHGLDVVQVFHDSPAWVRSGKSSGDKQPPSDFTAVYEFGQLFAKGLGKNVRSVEYWNEQNSAFFPGFPYSYANGLKAFSAGVKSVDPGINVLIGGAAGRPGKFFDDIYKNGVVNFIDIRNQHFYGKDAAVDGFYKSNVLEMEKTAGLDNKPGWLTEIGYSLRRDAHGELRDAEDEQAAYLVKAYVEGFAAGYERVFYFFWQELVEADYHTWGIMRDDLSPRPAYLALALLTRELSNYKIFATEQSDTERVVYFKSKSGEYIAVVWGKKIDLSKFGRDIVIHDIYGARVSQSHESITSGHPVIVSKINAVPSGVKRVIDSAPHSRSNQLIRLVVNVLVDGGDQSSPGSNRVSLNVPDGRDIEIRGTIYGGLGTTPKLACLNSSGIEVQGRQETVLSPLGSNGGVFSCKFKPKLTAIGEGWVGVKVSDGNASDQAYITIAPDPASADTLKSLDVKNSGLCLKWIGRVSSNINLSLEQSKAQESCSMVSALSNLSKRGESWTFLSAQVSKIDISKFSGIKVVIAALPAVEPPPRPIMLQLIESSGGVWLLELHPGKDGKTLSGLFNLARQAAWGKDNNGKLDLKDVQEIQVGWGGYAGEAGQRFGFKIEDISWLLQK